MNFARRAVLIMVWALLGSFAAGPRAVGAQAPVQYLAPGASAPLEPTAAPDLTTGHAWSLLPAISGSDSVLLHWPPRDGELAGPGTLRPALQLMARPTGLAAWGDTVHLVYERDRGRGENGATVSQRRVASVQAARGPAGTWEYLPAGRTRAEPPLPGDGDLAGFVATPVGPAALLGPEGAPGPLRLVVLQGGAWVEQPLPRGAEGANAATLLPLARGPALALWRGGAKLELWTSEATRAEGRATIAWAATPRAYTLPEPPGPAGESGSPRLLWLEGTLLAVEPRPQAGGRTVDVHAWILTSDAAVPLTTLEGLGAPISAVGLAGAGRLGLVFAEGPAAAPPAPGAPGASAAPAPAPRGPARGYRVREVGAADGAVRFEGPARSEALLTPRDYSVLLLVVGSVLAMVLLFVLRGENGQTVILPRHASLATPGKRSLAALMDFAPALIVGSWIHGVAPAEVLSLTVLLGGGVGVGPLATVLALAMVHTTAGELLWGRSLGKSLVGCEVVGLSRRRAEAPPAEDGEVRGAETVGSLTVGPPTPAQAVVRNIVKWFALPLGLLMFLDPNTRHPGDLAGRTLVVHREDEEPDGAEG